jgi:hypothetical protein
MAGCGVRATEAVQRARWASSRPIIFLARAGISVKEWTFSRSQRRASEHAEMSIRDEDSVSGRNTPWSQKLVRSRGRWSIGQLGGRSRSGEQIGQRPIRGREYSAEQ